MCMFPACCHSVNKSECCIVICNNYTYICWIITDAMNKERRAKTSLKKYTSHFIARFACERELETKQSCNILTPTLMAISDVSFSFSRCSTGGPGAHSAGFLYCILSSTGLVQKLHRGSRGPLLLVGGFPYHILSLTRLISNSLTSCPHRVI